MGGKTALHYTHTCKSTYTVYITTQGKTDESVTHQWAIRTQHSTIDLRSCNLHARVTRKFIQSVIVTWHKRRKTERMKTARGAGLATWSGWFPSASPCRRPPCSPCRRERAGVGGAWARHVSRTTQPRSPTGPRSCWSEARISKQMLWWSLTRDQCSQSITGASQTPLQKHNNSHNFDSYGTLHCHCTWRILLIAWLQVFNKRTGARRAVELGKSIVN